MSLTSHIHALRKKHEALEEKIAEAERHPGQDELTITTLKRRKLHIKEEITRLSAQ